MSAAALAEMTDGDVSQLEHVLAEHLFREGIGERRSWRHGLPILARELREDGLDEVEVILEHRLPLSSKRADVVLAGMHPRTGVPRWRITCACAPIIGRGVGREGRAPSAPAGGW